MATTESKKPVPIPDEASQPFFDGAKRGELMILRCGACGHFMWGTSHAGSLPITPRCPPLDAGNPGRRMPLTARTTAQAASRPPAM